MEEKQTGDFITSEVIRLNDDSELAKLPVNVQISELARIASIIIDLRERIGV